jgi:hypothetical protein
MNFQEFDDLHEDILDRARITPAFIDKNIYRLSVATLWANTALDPKVGALEPLHEYINPFSSNTLGREENLLEIFRFIQSKEGDLAMKEARLTTNHCDLLTYFASLILDPEGHEKWLKQALKTLDKTP